MQIVEMISRIQRRPRGASHTLAGNRLMLSLNHQPASLPSHKKLVADVNFD